MKTFFLLSLFILGISFSHAQKSKILYTENRLPLQPVKYLQLPLGAIKPQGHLLKMLELQRDGLSGHLDSIYSVVCGPQNGWLGGKGDCWERGPYWIDGLVPLAYILNDDALKKKVKDWMEWSIANQRPDGYFGPYALPEGFEKIKGTQQTNSEDWWPKMVMLKAMQQYYSATADERIPRLLTAYFRYQLKMLPKYPLDHWTFWGAQRGGDNLQVVLWLYNLTGEKFLLELAELIHQQTFHWTDVFTDNTLRNVNPYPDLHCVNIAQGLKEPVIYSQLNPDRKYIYAVKSGLDALRDVHGFVNGMYGADEMLHGNDPIQGSELCSAIELMYSLESVLPISGDLYYADYLEKIAYNVLPTQVDDHFTRKQYFQQVNQVLITDDWRHFDCDYNGRIVFGTTSGYPCCLANMHQGWPKFVGNLWYATSDKGLAALVYGPSSVKAIVGDGTSVEITENTTYPFSEHLTFNIKLTKPTDFPLYLRIPLWCKNPLVKVNGISWGTFHEGETVKIHRIWSENDKVDLQFPMDIRLSNWYERSLGIERGPLVYALKVEELWKEVKADNRDDTFFEVLPLSAWNYGITAKAVKELDFKVQQDSLKNDMPWNLANAPIHIKTKGKKIPHWTLYENSTGKLPYPAWPHRELDTPEEEIVLIPYGCSTLRIAEFPIVDLH
ncbi:MAG: glycoside hydrolase family 127 protein [Bacteroidales bacterium]|nr:glycoside hydrolase family 127 protein [Bacteroidales bacterium]